MLRRSRISAFCLSAILLLGFWAPARLWADGANPALPFRGSEDGGVTGLVPPNELTVETSGTATHLGQFTSDEELFLDSDGSFSGSKVFTAANGDQLWVEFRGAFTSPTTAEGTYSFAGGTGRFQGATGQAAFEAYSPDGVHLQATFDGSIRY